MKLFPMQVGRGQSAWVPWSLVESLAERLDANHGQTVERLAERSGLSPCELAAAIEDRRWHKMTPQQAWGVIWEYATEANEHPPVAPEGQTP